MNIAAACALVLFALAAAAFCTGHWVLGTIAAVLCTVPFGVIVGTCIAAGNPSGPDLQEWWH